MNRKLSREEVVKILYSMDINEDYSESIVNKHLEYFSEKPVDYEYLKKTIQDYKENKDRINELIENYSKDWKINRIAKVDLAILRVSVAEILFSSSIPNSVSINEAVEICKKYSNEDSHKFINGILGSINRGLNE